MTASTARPLTKKGHRRSTNARQNRTGWLFVGPFAIVFLAFLVLPIGFALYLSLFQKSLIGGTRFVFAASHDVARGEDDPPVQLWCSYLR